LFAADLSGGGQCHRDAVCGIAECDNVAQGFTDDFAIQCVVSRQGTAMSAQPLAEDGGQGLQIDRGQDAAESFITGNGDKTLCLAYPSAWLDWTALAASARPQPNFAALGLTCDSAQARNIPLGAAAIPWSDQAASNRPLCSTSLGGSPDP